MRKLVLVETNPILISILLVDTVCQFYVGKCDPCLENFLIWAFWVIVLPGCWSRQLLGISLLCLLCMDLPRDLAERNGGGSWIIFQFPKKRSTKSP